MNKSGFSNILAKSWVYIAILNGLLFLASRAANTDPFLSERAITTAVAAATYLILLLTTKPHIDLKGVLLFTSLTTTCIFVSIKSTIDFPAPAAFFFFVSIIALTSSRLPHPTNPSSKSATICLLGLIPILLIMYISKGAYFFQQGNRFVGFFSSPTTFSSWLCCLLTLAYSDNLSKAKNPSLLQLFIITTTAFLIYASGTRINIIIPIIILIHQFTNIGLNNHNSRRAALLITISLVLFIYPIYEVSTQYIPTEIIAFRFSGGTDTSFGLRYALFSAVSEILYSSSIIELLWGHGAEASRKLIIEQWGVDLFPHNDAIRIIYDFGAIFAAAFILTIINLASRHPLSTVLCILYFISFMHNMIYSHYLIALIIYTSISKNPNYPPSIHSPPPRS